MGETKCEVIKNDDKMSNKSDNNINMDACMCKIKISFANKSIPPHYYLLL